MQFQVEATCPLCSQSAEDREHVLTECRIYLQERREALVRILPLLEGTAENWDRETLTRLFIDCFSLSDEGVIHEGKEDQFNILPLMDINQQNNEEETDGDGKAANKQQE
jgi:hypothetical protein